MEDYYKKKYEEALERARIWKEKSGMPIDKQGILDNIFPELKESENERIRAFLHHTFTAQYLASDKLGRWHGEPVTNILAYLEKQGKQNPVDKVEPKLKVGDFIKHNKANITCKVISVNSGSYYVENIKTLGRIELFNAEQNFHPWTIQDAKDGDVLASSLSIFIFKGFYIANKPKAYCGVMNGSFIKCPEGCWTNEQCYPATEEQRKLLFEKMAVAGYEWNADKKELKKIEDEIEIPFGAKDSELQEETYYIPKGFHAEIDDNKVVFKKGEKPTAWSKEDEMNWRNAREATSRCYGHRSECFDWLRLVRKRLS